MHPRNRHQDRYDFVRLLRALPDLQRFVVRTPDGQLSIDFTDAAAVRMLNRALLRDLYGIEHWDIPPGYLCPPIPGRADYLHGLADLLAMDHGGVIPRGPTIRALDVGTGASCIYPLLGLIDYGWSFVATELDQGALASAQSILRRNGVLGSQIELRQQHDPARLLRGVLDPAECFDLSLCNPPFHRSAAEAAQGTTRKWRNLGVDRTARGSALNFGGQARELWCRGGELAFVRKLIDESVEYASSICWFTSLIAKAAHLAQLKQHALQCGARQIRVLDMSQGQKQSRFLAWTYLDPSSFALWRQQRWMV